MLILFLMVGAMSSAFISVDGLVTITPSGTILALSGNRTVIRCSTDNKSTLTWKWKRPGYSFANKIHTSRVHEIRYTLPGELDLIIANVTANVAATYTCEAGAGGGIVTTTFAVLESLPSCHASVRNDDKSAIELVENGTVSIRCKYRHTSNMPPNSISINWTDHHGNVLRSTLTPGEFNPSTIAFTETESRIQETPAIDSNATVYTFTAVFGGTSTTREVNHVTSLNGRAVFSIV